jgi:arabinofuranosyltransferase
MQLSLPRFVGGRTICLLIGAAALLTLLIRTGWATEDSYISFRVVDNFLNGYGLTWNVGERVQVYTDPLFLILLILGTSISGSVYWSSVVISLLMTMAVFFLLTHKRGTPVILVITAIFLASKAFMDFSVSGMENPATHLGIAAFFWAYWNRRSPLILTLIVSLTSLNRIDSLPLLLPALGWIYWQTGRKVWLDAVVGFFPLLVWEAFSVFYYGFPFPNTAYAKLGAGIDHMFLIGKGLEYLECSLAWDKVTPAVILAGFVLALWKREWPLALGLLASILYVIRVGGDFMAGRFLTAPFVFATAIVISHVRFSIRSAASLSAVILLSTFLNPRPTLTTTSDFGVKEKPFDISHFYKVYFGIADERAFFYRATGVLRWKPGLRWPNSGWSSIGDRIRQSGVHTEIIHGAGTIPYHIGPRVHTIDAGALGDPLLARLPSKPGELRPGHYYRDVPDGYFETIDTGVNRISDPKLAEYYGHLHTIVSGDLWSTDRMEEIIAMNLGRYDHLLPKRP